NPELIKRMIDEGHIVGNHSVTHPSFAEISTEQMTQEVTGMEEYLQENFNYSESYFRFPKGEYNEIALKQLNKLGYTCVFWSLAYADWDLNNQKGTNYAYEKVVSRLHPGAVILLHSVSPDNANALSDIIDEARRQGYKFLSLRDYQQN
ncbi:MAG: polysaccharide deacetylase family protein, partial [Clostridia bacterium]|nr:polysaccharide deacetylase family protein [Clostridia bacterium]